MSKICLPNEESPCRTKPFGSGAQRFGPDYAKRLKRRQGRLGDTWFLDEVFVTINGRRQYLWRAVDQDGDVIDILVQSRRNRRAAERFFRKLLKNQGNVPFRLVTDKLKSYGAALRSIMPSVNHDTQRYANNRAEVSHQPTPAARTTNAPVQVSTTVATLPFGARCRSESFPIGQTQTKSGSPPDVESAVFCDLGSDHGRLIDHADPVQVRPSDLKLTVPRKEIDNTMS